MMPTQVFIAPDGKEFFRNEGTFERDHIMQVFTKMGVAPPNMQGAAPRGGAEGEAGSVDLSSGCSWLLYRRDGYLRLRFYHDTLLLHSSQWVMRSKKQIPGVIELGPEKEPT